jgi:hypothetical protein
MRWQPLRVGEQSSLQITPDRTEVARDGFCVSAGTRRRSKLLKPTGISAKVQQASSSHQT